MGPLVFQQDVGRRATLSLKKSQQTQLPAVQTLQILKKVGRGEKRVTGCLL